MNLKKHLYLIIALIIAFGAYTNVDSYAKKQNQTTSKTTAKSAKSSNSKSKDSKNGKDSKSKNSSKSDSKSKGKDTKANKNGKNSNKSNGKGNGKNSKSNKQPAKKSAPAGASGKKSSAPKETASNDSLTLLVNSALTRNVAPDINPGGLRVNKANPNMSTRQLSVQLNDNFTYLPVNKELINDFEQKVKEVLPDSLSGFKVNLNVGNHPYSYYINVLDKLPEQYRENVPFVEPALPYVHAKKGMENDIVAMWHSHGRYYRPGSGWAWQRPFLFETAEDVYTMSYVLPFITPMLENAGAYVFLPRERDFSRVEVIVDNDYDPSGEIYSQHNYTEVNGAKAWETGQKEGFIYNVQRFRDTENPFEGGTYRQVSTVKGGKESSAGWYPEMPEDGEYAIYISYKSLPNSTEDAHYTINYSGGSREYVVNQTMGGGTWIYLGTFPLRKGKSEIPVITLSNRTNGKEGTVVTADAVKIGGGMGNIERSAKRKDVYWDYDDEDITPAIQQAMMEDENVAPQEEDDDDGQAQSTESDESSMETTPQNAPASTKTSKKGPAPHFTTSGLPRFLEGARYWLHWAGFPESVYSSYHGSDDYKDDYTSRGKWVNYLAGGSRVLPRREGLGIPVDVSFALHTDAGLRQDESIVGTLGIYYTDGGKMYTDGTPRKNSRILTDMVMRQVVGDIRNTFEPNWTRRSMWDKSYAEARSPEVPAMLMELLSHQNFADMRYGLDPTFRFTVARAIYKGLGRFVAERKGREFIVQPLPVQAFMINREKKGVYKLSWKPTDDKLEPTAKPDKYIIMERTEGNLGFTKIGETKSTSYEVKVNDSKIHSYYVIAANDGGLSFPSETLALKEGNGKPVLIVNGFTRVSAPDSFIEGRKAGFKSQDDFGVPYKYDISFTGYQTEFSRNAGEGFGKSGSGHVSTVVGGNTFDYPAVHGAAIGASGRGFVSSSVKAVEEGDVKLSNYSTVDLILGKQKTIDVGGTRGKRKNIFPTFSAQLQQKLAPYVEKGGRLIVSGQNIVRDLYSSKAPRGSAEFAENTLGIANTTDSIRCGNGTVKIDVLEGMAGKSLKYSNSLRKDHYIVEKADIIEPAPGAEYDPIMLFSDGGATAGIIVDRGKGTVAVMSIPFESLLDSEQAAQLMKEILKEIE